MNTIIVIAGKTFSFTENGLMNLNKILTGPEVKVQGEEYKNGKYVFTYQPFEGELVNKTVTDWK